MVGAVLIIRNDGGGPLSRVGVGVGEGVGEGVGVGVGEGVSAEVVMELEAADADDAPTEFKAVMVKV